ncbi:MAG: DUF4198 domain-containing protein [Fusobacterium sp.]|uniref:DUF4198 domain-containing protein n=1 Tax=Fusobacterium sp. TaxID=68766 RepID=UPI0026DDC7EE|nr:DUF4198 domain-containing protein [Fusobacterium sp.]MDO4690684.1 DUF4198 domain-containing protein [Fusobacterium sp.]
MSTKKILVTALFSCLSISAFSHFQMLYTENSDISGKASVPFELIFTHPADGVEAHSMDIGKDHNGKILPVEAFFSVHNEEKNDLKKFLMPSKFGKDKKVTSYKFNLDRNSGLKGGGDWGLVFVPAPYYEQSEDIFIQQVTKVFVNKDEIPTDWSSRIAEGYPEIIALSNPITWENQIFRGQVVDAKGKAVANAEIEVEYLNAEIKNSMFTGKNKEEKVATVIYADANGYFSFVPVHKGYWGFAALGAGGELKHNGKELSQDAVLWIEAK